MYIYNITIKIDWYIQSEWLEWMRHTHIPELLSFGHFSKHILLQLKDIDEQDGPTYALQLFAESKAQYNAFVSGHLADVLSTQQARWMGKMLCFSTLMEIVH